MPEGSSPGILYVVSTPIGNLDDITYRAVKVLNAVDLIAAEDTRTTSVLLNHYGIHKPMTSYHGYNERRRTPQLIDHLTTGRSVALVSDAGTPGISDPAQHIVRAALAHSIPVIPIPGASAFVAALVVSGLPTDRFVFEGFLPLKKGRRTKLESLKHEPRTVVIYESPHRILKTLDALAASLGERNVVVARELTKKFEEVTRGPLSSVRGSLGKVQARGEYVIVVEGAAHHFLTSEKS